MNRFDAPLALSIALVGVAFALGCAGFGSDVSEAPSDELPLCEQVRVVLEENCVACHGSPATNGAPGYLRLDTFEDVEGVQGIVSQSGRSAARAAGRSMPPASFGTLTEAQIAILTDWHDGGASLDGCREGAPSDAGTGGESDAGADASADTDTDTDAGVDVTDDAGSDAGSDASPDADAPPTLNEVHAAVFAVGCASHHFSAEIPNLSLDDGLLGRLTDGRSGAAGLAYIVPGDPEASFLYQKITGTQDDPGRTGGDRMPPPPSREPLSEEQIQLVFEWIEAGAPDPDQGRR